MSDTSTSTGETGDNTGDTGDNTYTITEGQLGEGGKKALDAERRARSLAEKAATATAKERDDLARRLEEYEANNKSEHEKALEKAVKEAEQRGRSEAQTAANQRLIKSEVRVAAATRLTDPEDAVRFLDLGEFSVDDDGEVDSKAITSAIDALVKAKPYLAGKTKPQGDIDQGARGGDSDRNVQPGIDRIAHAYAQSGKANT